MAKANGKTRDKDGWTWATREPRTNSKHYRDGYYESYVGWNKDDVYCGYIERMHQTAPWNAYQWPCTAETADKPVACASREEAIAILKALSVIDADQEWQRSAYGS